MMHGGGDLDDLQDDAVGERVGGGDVVSAGEHGDARGLEDADVGRRGGDDGGDVDGEQHRRGAGDPDAVSRPSAISSSQQDIHCSPHAPSCSSGRDRRLAGMAKDAQPVAHAHERRRAARRSGPAGARARDRGAGHEHGREQHATSAASGASAAAISAP